MTTQSQRAQSAVKLTNHNARYTDSLQFINVLAAESGFIRKTYIQQLLQTA